MLSCLCTCLYERCSGLILAPFDDVQPSAVGNNAFKCAVAMFVCGTHLCRKVFDDLVEVAIVKNKLLHQCFQAQHLDRTAMPKLPHALWCIAFSAKRVSRVEYQGVNVSGAKEVFQQCIRA